MTGAVTGIADSATRHLEPRLRGRLIRPGDVDYHQARQVWNGMIDRRPALIVQCAGPADVIEAVRFVRNLDAPVAVRGGGHNVSGSSICDDGVVIDLSRMTGIRVDPQRQTVRVEAGATIGDLDRETQMFGLAVPMGVVTQTGVAGLTLGGGLGWLRRRYGLSCDNLRSVDIVTGTGDFLTASPHQHPDLLWALAGGGGNFGVVTSFEFQAHPVGPEVYFAFVVHPRHRVREVLDAFRRWAPTAPEEVSAFAILWHAPHLDGIDPEHWGVPGIALLAMHCGEVSVGERVLRELREIGDPVADFSGPTDYLSVQRFFDADYPAHEKRYYWKSRFLAGLPDEAIDLLIEINEGSPSPESTIDIWQLGGAISRLGSAESAFGDRSAPYLVGIEANWYDPAADQVCLTWARQAYVQLGPFSTGSAYLNFPGMYEEQEQLVRAAFGDNLPRLTEVKRRYDPGNRFSLNPNIHP